jgi:hypothetical protein
VIDGENPDSSCKTCGCKTGRKVQAGVAVQEDADFLLASGFSEQVKKSIVKTKKEEDQHSSSQSSDPVLSIQDKPIVDIPDAMADNSTSRHAGDDGMIEQTAKYLLQLLWAFSLEAGTYPETLDELDLTGVDLKGIEYIPSGENGVFQTYQLKVEYSDVIETMHPY